MHLVWIFCLSACRYLRRSDSGLSQHKSFERSHYIQWNLYDNCTAGNINYRFRGFEISSHHLLAACIRLDKTSLGSAASHHIWEISFPCGSLCIKKSAYGMSLPVLDLRCWGKVFAKSAWQQYVSGSLKTVIATYSTRLIFFFLILWSAWIPDVDLCWCVRLYLWRRPEVTAGASPRSF